MRIIDLALNDLLQILRDWKAVAFLVVMPIGFTLMFGFLFGGIFSGGSEAETDPRIPVAFVDQDQELLSETLFELLSLSDTVRPFIPEGEQTLNDLRTQVEAGELAAVVIVPDGYSTALLKSEALILDVIINTDSGAGTTAQFAIQSTITRLLSVAQTAQFSTQTRAALEPFVDQTAQQSYFENALNETVVAWENPPVEVRVSQTGQEPIDEGEAAFSTNAFTQSSAGMMVQFAIAGLMSAAEVLVLERQSGSLRRLLTTSIRRYEILLGHFFAMFVMIFLQFAILIFFAQVFLSVPYFSAPLATLVMALATATFAAALGLLIGTLAKIPEQVVVYSLIPMFILSGLGGAWMPLEFTGETFQKIAYLTPLAWAMDGFKNITVRGQGLEAVILPAIIVLAFAALCFGLSAWRFKFEEA
jgi:ABC-2 type transport system permease protein